MNLFTSLTVIGTLFTVLLTGCAKNHELPPFQTQLNGFPNNQSMQPSARPAPKIRQTSTTSPSAMRQAEQAQSTQNTPNTTSQTPNSQAIVQDLAIEYTTLSDKFATQGFKNASNAFSQKAITLRRTGEVKIESIPQSIKDTAEGFSLSNLAGRIPPILDNTNFSAKNSKVVAKLIGTYECSIVELIETMRSNGQTILNQCYDKFQGVLTATEDEMKRFSKSTNGLAGSKYIESVNKTFTVVEFDPMSYSVDISNINKFKEINDILQTYQDYDITIVGYELTDTSKLKTGNPKIVAKNAKKIRELDAKNDLTKKRVLAVRQALTLSGVNKDKIKMAHPDSSKTGFLFNLKGNLYDLAVIDIKTKD